MATALNAFDALDAMSEQLSIITELPEGFLEVEPRQIRKLLPTPTLLKLRGDEDLPLFVTILLHGNEYSGLKSVQSLLAKYRDDLPRSLYLFVGNVAAAEANKRFLSGQVDFNRCWPGTDLPDSDAARLMQQVFDEVTADGLFAAIDVHNTNGTNPHYAGMTDVTQHNMHLAAMFNHIAVAFRSPRGVSTMAFDGVCPAITIECGRPGDAQGIRHASELIDALLHMDHFPQRPVAPHDLQLVRSLVTLKVAPDVSFDFNLSSPADLIFDSSFERKNFTEISSNEVFGYTRVERPLKITNQRGEDVTDEIIRIEDGNIYLNRSLMPTMITLDKNIVRQDCLCYLMEDYHDRA